MLSKTTHQKDGMAGDGRCACSSRRQLPQQQRAPYFRRREASNLVTLCRGARCMRQPLRVVQSSFTRTEIQNSQNHSTSTSKARHGGELRVGTISILCELPNRFTPSRTPFRGGNRCGVRTAVRRHEATARTAIPRLRPNDSCARNGLRYWTLNHCESGPHVGPMLTHIFAQFLDIYGLFLLVGFSSTPHPGRNMKAEETDRVLAD